MATAVNSKPDLWQRALEWGERDREYSKDIETWLSPKEAWTAHQMVLRGHIGDPRLLEPLCSAYLVWHHQPDPGITVAEGYFAEFPEMLRGREDWYQSQRGSWLGLWEIETVDPSGCGLDVVDRLTGERRRVAESHAGGAFIKPSYTVLGRVVDIDDQVSVFSGTHTIRLPFHASAAVRNAFMREMFPSRSRVRPAALRDDVLFMMLKEKWNYAADLWFEMHGADEAGRIRDLGPGLAETPVGRKLLETVVNLLIDDL